MLGYVPGPQLDHVAIRVGHVGGSARAVERDLLHVGAALVSRPLADEGFTLSYPVVTLIVLLVLAALAGVVAAIGPARRASRLDVLRAIATE